MKKFLTMLVLTTVLLMPFAAQAQTKGNGLPMGQKLLYNLEVIAYDGDHCPNGDPNGHRIAVKADVNDLDKVNGADPTTLIRQNDIMLTAGPFQVLSGNACKNGTASFQLPTNPCSDINTPCDVDNPAFQNYEVYGRLVGAPKTGVTVTTCATDPNTSLIVCSTESWISVRTNGKTGGPPKFTNVSRELLSLCLDIGGTGKCNQRIALFSGGLQDFFWNWDTTGKAHAQLFFVALPD
jgi:hypothetical protein